MPPWRPIIPCIHRSSNNNYHPVLIEDKSRYPLMSNNRGPIIKSITNKGGILHPLLDPCKIHCIALRCLEHFENKYNIKCRLHCNVKAYTFLFLRIVFLRICKNLRICQINFKLTPHLIDECDESVCDAFFSELSLSLVKLFACYSLFSELSFFSMILFSRNCMLPYYTQLTPAEN